LRDWIVSTSSPDETRELGRFIGKVLCGTAVIYLTGDLGAGKTCLVQGLAGGLDVPADEPVTSPSYTLMNHYHGRLDLFHFDLYRLSGADDLLDLGFEEYVENEGVTVVEWADRVPDQNREVLLIRLLPEGNTDRRVVFQGRGEKYEELLARLEGAWRERGCS
jgi:tRNA threonylcarbamoyladenosine biosynthesis protein TsaE